MQNLVLAKVCDENRKKKVKKMTGISYKWCERNKELLNEDKRQRFMVGDIDSILIKGTINVVKKGRRLFFGGRRMDKSH